MVESEERLEAVGVREEYQPVSCGSLHWNRPARLIGEEGQSK
jgi:hypothetical protein